MIIDYYDLITWIIGVLVYYLIPRWFPSMVPMVAMTRSVILSDGIEVSVAQDFPKLQAEGQQKFALKESDLQVHSLI